MNWVVPGAGMGTKPHSLGGELGVYAPRCRSISRGTPSRWEWRSCETASGMSSLRPAGPYSSGPSADARSTASSGAGRLGGSKADRRGCAPWQPGGRAGPPSTGRVGGGLQHGDHGGLGAHGGPTARRGRHCDASAVGYRVDTQGCGGGTGDLSGRRGLYRRWCLASGSPSESEAAVRSTSSSGSCLRRCFRPRPPRWALRAGYSLSGSGAHGV